MSIVPKESALPAVCPLCGAAADEHHHRNELDYEWASYDCELVLVVGCKGDIEWDAVCSEVLNRWIESANKARRAAMSANQQ